LLNSNSIEKFKAKVTPLYEELKQAQERLELEIKQENEDRDLAFAFSLEEDSEREVVAAEQPMSFSDAELAAARRVQEQLDGGRAGQQGGGDNLGLSREELLEAEQDQRRYDEVQAAGNRNLPVLGLRALDVDRPRRCPMIAQNQLTVRVWSAVVIAYVARNYL
jgi:hypothetical protein